MNQLKYDINVLLLCDQGIWVAQCLEHDIAAQGKTIKQAMKTFSKSFAGQVFMDVENGKQPLEDFTPAPVEYWDMLKEALIVQSHKTNLQLLKSSTFKLILPVLDVEYTP